MQAPFLTSNKRKRYHFIGIGGIGMSALAHILLDKQMWVQGSDKGSSPILSELEKKGALIYKEHSASHISRGDTVVYSSAINPDNPEFQAAEALGCKMLHRSELLSELIADHKSVAIAGTHGKTTTSSMLTAILLQAKMDPSFALGGLLNNRNGQKGKGGHFLFEADESDGSLLNYSPDVAIITNVEPEHMDHYKTEVALRESYATFASQVKEFLLYCGDHMKMQKGESYGFSSKCKHVIKNFEQNEWNLSFDIGRFKKITVAAIGRHNALNAAAAFLMALHLGIPEESIRSALKGFSGVKRRCEKRGDAHGILQIDDYAHHPTEIHTTLRGIKEAIGERRLVVLFQPHRYSRTQDHLVEFGRAFEWADEVYITDIFLAREKPIPGLSAQSVIDEVKKHHQHCHYIARSDCPDKIELRPHDVFVTMGAGDIYKAHKEFLPKKWKAAVLAGGRSPEHEISLRSAQFVFDSLNPAFYEKELFTIHKDGSWSVGDIHGPLSAVIHKLEECEIVLPILHGPNAEDGTIQGFLKTLNKPFVGPDHLGCAIAMNKVLAKKLAQAEGVPTPPYTYFHKLDWMREKERCLNHGLSYPVYVKAAHLGSSIGTYCVKSAEELESAIENALRYDCEVMIEEGRVACREIEFAVLGNHDVQVPKPGEKLALGEFVSYEMKYGTNPVPTSIDPTLTKETLARGQEFAKRTYRALHMSGLSRVDFLLDPQNNWWFFELNAIPGMQKLSLFPKIWNREGLSPSRLVDQLVILALARARC